MMVLSTFSEPVFAFSGNSHSRFSLCGRDNPSWKFILITKVLHASVFIYGITGAAFAFGMIAGGIALMQIKIKESQQSKLVVLVLVITSFSIIGVSTAGHWLIVVILDVVAGAMISVLTNLISIIFIQRSPSEMRGRIGAALNAFINLGMIGALLISGPLLDWLGTRKLLAVAGIAALLLIGIFSPALFREKAMVTEE